MADDNKTDESYGKTVSAQDFEEFCEERGFEFHEWAGTLIHLYGSRAYRVAKLIGSVGGYHMPCSKRPKPNCDDVHASACKYLSEACCYTIMKIRVPEFMGLVKAREETAAIRKHKKRAKAKHPVQLVQSTPPTLQYNPSGLS
jgi:hypothetical protein